METQKLFDLGFIQFPEIKKDGFYFIGGNGRFVRFAIQKNVLWVSTRLFGKNALLLFDQVLTDGKEKYIKAREAIELDKSLKPSLEKFANTHNLII